MIILGIIVAFILFSFIILIHEFGHFSAARKFGVKVEEFGLGIPPRAKKLFTDKKGTLFSLNRLPIGGFVKLKGGNIHTAKNKNDTDMFLNKPVWQQSIILLGGVFMNFLLAGVIFSILFMVGVKPLNVNTVIPTDIPTKIIPNMEQALDSGFLKKEAGVILFPVEGSIAEQSGIKENDVLHSIIIDNKKIDILSSEDLIKNISSNPGQEIFLNIFRDYECPQCPEGTICEICLQGENITLSTTSSSEGRIGSYIVDNIKINKEFTYNYTFLESIEHGFKEVYYQSLLTCKALGMLVGNLVSPETPADREQAIKGVKGPIGLIDFISNTISEGFIFLLILTAIISINLGVFNLLPLPALDGGRFFFININTLFKLLFKRKIISDGTEAYIHLIFFLFLIALSIIIAYNDIINIISS